MPSSRRQFLRNAGLAALAALEAGAVAYPTVALAAPLTGRSKFGFMFGGLAPFRPAVTDLAALAATMADAGSIPNPSGDGAIFTYFGQFVDHDLTRDNHPLPHATPALQIVDPTTQTNFRTFAFDLDSIYSVGAAGFAGDGVHLRAPVNANGVGDLPRNPDGTAIIGDSRNDENELVSQVHHAWLLFHNNVVDALGLNSLSEARETVTRYYQWLVLKEFLPKIVGQGVVDGFVGGTLPSFYKPGNPNAPLTPVEWSGAAFRQHTMVRTEYQLNGADGGHRIFDGTDNDLHGSRPLPAGRAIDFRMFVNELKDPAVGPFQVYDAFDTRISSPGLFTLPIGPTAAEASGTAILALRNMIRGASYGLPSGQAVATAMGITPIPPETAISPADVTGFETGTPLWYYVNKESELGGGDEIGPVGGRIIADVFTGIMKADKKGLLHNNSPTNGRFSPAPPIAATAGEFTLGDFIRFAGLT